MLAAGLVGYGSNEESNEEIMDRFAVQSFEVDYRNSGSQYDVSAATRNAGKRDSHKEDKKNFLEPQYDDRKRVLKKKT